MLEHFGVVVKAPLFVRCAQPDADGFTSLRELGVGLAYKLNTPREFSPAVEAHLFGGQVQQIDQFSFNPSIDFVKKTVEQLDIYVSSGIGVVVHCTHGRDRTGFLVAAWRILKHNWKADDAINEMKRYGASGMFELADAPFIRVLKELGG